MSERPKLSNSLGDKELEKAEKKFDEFKDQLDSLTFDKLNAAPKKEEESQTKLSQKEISNSKDIYLKPKRSISSKEKFNESFRDDYNYQKEYVCFIAENKEVIGESINLWTKKFPGQPAEEWEVPVNKPLWGPRYLAERIKECTYHRLSMQDSTIIGSDHMGTYTGSMVVDSSINRLNAYPANPRKSVFMGSSVF